MWPELPLALKHPQNADLEGGSVKAVVTGIKFMATSDFSARFNAAGGMPRLIVSWTQLHLAEFLGLFRSVVFARLWGKTPLDHR